jgi:hypothetical protein
MALEGHDLEADMLYLDTQPAAFLSTIQHRHSRSSYWRSGRVSAPSAEAKDAIMIRDDFDVGGGV